MEDKQKSEGFNIVLTCRGEELYRLNSKDFVEAISIGRSEDCTWSVGHLDSTVSGRHAMISQRKKNFYLTDLGSRNGMYLDERKVKEVCLGPGMTIHFGECSLSIEQPGQRNVSKVPPYFLKYTNEKGRTVKFKLMPGTIKIGGSEKYDIFLNSGLVSSPHAAVTRKKDGSCWIRDLKSRNGTEVNHAELPSKHERLLKNGDVISIADTDMTFWDASGIREKFHLKLALMTLVATFVVCVTGYLVYLRMTPSAEEYLQLARRAARMSNFGAARLAMQRAATARDASDTATARKQLSERINTWEHSATNWKAVQEAMVTHRIGLVPQLLGNMELRYVSAWDWNEDGMVETRKRVDLVKNGCDAMVRLFAILKDNQTTKADIEREREKLSRVITECEGYSEAYLQKLKEECAGYKTLADKSIEGLSRIDALLASLGEAKTDVDVSKEIAALEALRKGAPSMLVSRIESILPHFYGIRKAEEILVKRKANILAMKFAENDALVLDMPKNTLSLKSLDKKIAEITEKDHELVAISQYLETYCRVLSNEGIAPGRDCASLAVFLNRDTMDKVFACDSLSMKLPSKSRKAACGKYDEIVGIEYLHSSLVMVRTQDSVRSRYDIPLTSQLELASSHILMMKTTLEYIKKNCGSWPLSGELAAYVEYLKSQFVLRDKIVAEVLSHAGAEGQRQYFIAHGICVKLDGLKYTLDMRNKLGREYSELRSKLQSLNSDYTAALADDAIAIREKVLSIGLPGDPVVRRMWSLR